MQLCRAGGLASALLFFQPNSAMAGGKKKPGLYENIRKRRAAGKKPRKPGSKGAPTAQDFKNAARTAKKRK